MGADIDIALLVEELCRHDAENAKSSGEIPPGRRTIRVSPMSGRSRRRVAFVR